MRLRRPVPDDVLRERLDTLVATFDISTIEPDPLQLVLRYTDPLDQEVAGLIAAAFAYGRAYIIVSNIGALLAAMGDSPFVYVARFERAEGERHFRGFAHRFHKTADVVDLLERLAAVIAEHGSLGGLFRACYEPSDADTGPSLDRFVKSIIGVAGSPSHPVTGNESAEGRARSAGDRKADLSSAHCALRSNDHFVHAASPPSRSPGNPVTRRPGNHAKSLQYLLSSPQDGSACKRMNLFLRWMVRRTPPDLGLWNFVDPSKLVMPLDTHVHRIATFLGLNDRKSADWKTARLLTDRLARLDAADPVRYDFALCRLGILDLCSRTRRKENCDVCLLRDVCRFPVVKSK